MKVFITGATGYIGFSAALALRRAGHEVWGLVRSEEKAASLRRNEIRPVLGTLQRPETFAKAAENAAVIVHAAADPADFSATDNAVVEALLKLAVWGPQPKTFVYTSGVWVHGNTNDGMADETTPIAPARVVSWRPAVEKLVLHSKVVRGIVLRPGCVYGKKGGLTGMWFKGAAVDRRLRVVGDGNNHWAMVHVDDLADAYRRAAESGLTNEVFDIVDATRETVGQMAAAVARATGYDGKVEFVPVAEAAKTMGDLAEALALDQHIDARKATRYLGWQPSRHGFSAEAPVFFEAWKEWSR